VEAEEEDSPAVEAAFPVVVAGSPAAISAAAALAAAVPLRDGDGIMRKDKGSFASMKTRSQQPYKGMTEIGSQQPHRGMTEIASRFNGWDKNAKRMRAVGTRLAMSFVAYLRGTPAAHLRLPAVKTAGYPCQMPTASALRNLRNLNK
jgi:hypothetical protein